jgi:hypothetical protein
MIYIARGKVNTVVNLKNVNNVELIENALIFYFVNSNIMISYINNEAAQHEFEEIINRMNP